MSSVQMQIRTVPRVTGSPGAAGRLLGRGAPEGGGKRKKEPDGWRSAGGALSDRSTRMLSLVLAGRLTSSREPPEQQTAQRPRAPAPRASGRLSAPAPPRRPVPGEGGLGGTPTSPARGGQCAGLLPRAPRTPAVTAAGAGWGGAPAGPLSSPLIPLARDPRAAPGPPEARQESRVPGPGPGQAQRPAARGTAGAQGPACRGRCCAAAKLEAGGPAGAGAAERPRVALPAPSLSPRLTCAAARAGRRGRFLLATSWGGARWPRRPRRPFHFPAAGGAPGPGRRLAARPSPSGSSPSSDPPRPPPILARPRGAPRVPNSLGGGGGGPTRVALPARRLQGPPGRPPPPGAQLGILAAGSCPCTCRRAPGQSLACSPLANGAPPGPLVLKVGLTHKQ